MQVFAGLRLQQCKFLAQETKHLALIIDRGLLQNNEIFRRKSVKKSHDVCFWVYLSAFQARVCFYYERLVWKLNGQVLEGKAEAAAPGMRNTSHASAVSCMI